MTVIDCALLEQEIAENLCPKLLPKLQDFLAEWYLTWSNKDACARDLKVALATAIVDYSRNLKAYTEQVPISPILPHRGIGPLYMMGRQERFGSETVKMLMYFVPKTVFYGKSDLVETFITSVRTTYLTDRSVIVDFAKLLVQAEAGDHSQQQWLQNEILAVSPSCTPVHKSD